MSSIRPLLRIGIAGGFILAIGIAFLVDLNRSDRDAGPAEASNEKGIPNQQFFLKRAYPYGEIPLADWRKTLDEAAEMRRVSRGTSAWTFAGPENVGGRVTDLAVDPTDENVVYAATASGGVFKTIDGGVNWTPVFDEQSSLSIGDVTLDPSDPSVVYVGTGEVNGGGSSVTYGGDGVYVSRDAGATWESLGLRESAAIGRILVDPTNSDRIFVAAMGRQWDENPERGIYRSFDGGDTWTQVLYVSDRTGCVDLVMRPDDPDVVFAAMWERVRTPFENDYGGPNCSVQRTDDGGDTWSVVAGGLPAPHEESGRIGLTICESVPNTMYAVYVDRDGDFDGVYKSEDGGVSWAPTPTDGLTNLFNGSGWYFGNVRVAPDDPDHVFVLGVWLGRSANGGQTWNTLGTMHVDQHALEWGSTKAYLGNDGGVYVGGPTDWTKLDSTPITQVYRVAFDPSAPERLYVGSQDNGTTRTLTGATNDWEQIMGADGFQALIHPLDSDQIWAQMQWGWIRYSSDGGYSWDSASFEDHVVWDMPLIQNPHDPDRRLAAGQSVWSSVTPTTWIPISPPLAPFGRTLTTLSVSPVDPQVIWAGSQDGGVWCTSDGGQTWNDRSAGLPDRWITSVHADPYVPRVAFVTVSGFRWADTMAHIYRTHDLGASWIPMDDGLPDVPINDILHDPDQWGRLFAASDVGVFESTDYGASWTMRSEGLPNVIVSELDRRPGDPPELVAATYGRGVYTLPIEPVLDDPDPLLEFHVTEPSYSGCSTLDETDLTCGDLTQPGPFVGTSFVWVLLKERESRRLPHQRVRFGLTYDAAVSVHGWTLCASAAQMPQNGAGGTWPDSGTGIQIEWGDCPVMDGYVKIGYLAVTSDGTGAMQFGPDGASGALDASWCDGTTNALSSESLGSIDFAAGTTPACGASVSTPDSAEFGPRSLLSPIVPNPGSAVRATLVVPRASRVSAAVFDVSGRLVARLIDGERGAGTYEIRWDGLGGDGRRASPAVYVLRVQVGDRSEARKLVLTR